MTCKKNIDKNTYCSCDVDGLFSDDINKLLLSSFNNIYKFYIKT